MRHALRALASASLCALLAGCGKSSPTTPTPPSGPSEIDLAIAAASNLPDVLRDEAYETTASAGASARIASPFAALDPLSYFRWYRTANPSFAVAFADTAPDGHARRADVSVTRDLRGMLHIVRRPAEGVEPDTHLVVHKVISELWNRKLRFARTTTPTVSEWTLVALSPVKVRSVPGSLDLDSLSVTVEGQLSPLFVIRDPAALQSLDELPIISDGLNVRIDAYSQGAGHTTVLHTAAGRYRMATNVDGHASITLVSGLLNGPRAISHFAVNVMSFETLHDDVQPYNSITWIVPLRIAPLP